MMPVDWGPMTVSSAGGSVRVYGSVGVQVWRARVLVLVRLEYKYIDAACVAAGRGQSTALFAEYQNPPLIPAGSGTHR